MDQVIEKVMAKAYAKIEDGAQAILVALLLYFGFTRFRVEAAIAVDFVKLSAEMGIRSAWRLLNHNVVVGMRSLYRTVLGMQLMLAVVGAIPLLLLFYRLMAVIYFGLTVTITFILWMRLHRLRGVHAFMSVDALTADNSAVRAFGPNNRFSAIDPVLFSVLFAGQGFVIIGIAAVTSTIYNTSMVFIWPMTFVGMVVLFCGYQFGRLMLYMLLLLIEGPGEWAENAMGRLARTILDPALLGIDSSNVGDLLPDSFIDEAKRAIAKIRTALDQVDRSMIPLVIFAATIANVGWIAFAVFCTLPFGYYQAKQLTLGGEAAKKARASIEHAEKFLYGISVLTVIVYLVSFLFFGVYPIPKMEGSLGFLLMTFWGFMAQHWALSLVTVAVLYQVARWSFAPQQDITLLTLRRVGGIIVICVGVVIAGINLARFAGVDVSPQASYFNQYEFSGDISFHCLNGIRDFDESTTDRGPSCGPHHLSEDAPSGDRRIGASTPFAIAPTADGNIIDQFLCWSWLEWRCPQPPPPPQEPANNAAPEATPIAAPDSTSAYAQRRVVDTSQMVASLSAHVASNGSLPPTPFDDIIEDASRQLNVDKLLIRAVIKHESNFNPNARGSSGEKGLMQLMPRTARAMGVSNAFDPEENIFGGTRYLRRNLDLCGQDVRCALARYNGGPRGMHSFNAQRYAGRVMARYTAYQNGTAVEPAPSRRHRAPRIESSDSVLVERETTRDSSRVTMARLDDSVCDEFSEFFLERMRSQGRCR